MQRALAALGFLALIACQRAQPPPDADSDFARLQKRGETVMGVNQYTSKHVFQDLPSGGRIVLDRDDASDTAAIRAIRTHMVDIQRAFQRGDFGAPGLVHARDVPGTQVLAAKRSVIKYAAVNRPRGAEVRILTTDTAAITAVHEFLAFQRMDHHAAGHEGH